MLNKWYNKLIPDDEQRNNIATLIYDFPSFILSIIGFGSIKLSEYAISKVNINRNNTKKSLKIMLFASNIHMIWVWTEKMDYKMAHSLNEFFEIPEYLR